MNYQRVSKHDIHFQWEHRRGFWSRCNITLASVSKTVIVKSGGFQSMYDLYHELTTNNPDSTCTVDLDYVVPEWKPKP